ncbi:hypothetical protein [Psychrobacter pygoscelis]|uniref:hypothetical protein n=1 Tax=Psychrobacter pygoscelis TaxID=2488563 RepID=UPI00103FC7A8|nr:hypothetical protein [Psychrobacter pygoscelis]
MFKPAWFSINDVGNPNGRLTYYQLAGGIGFVSLIVLALGNALVADMDTDIDIESIALDAGFSPADYEVNEDGSLTVYPSE